MAQAFPVLLVVRNSEGEVRWMEVRDWLKRASDNGKKAVKQIVFEGGRFDVMSVRRWREKILCAQKMQRRLRPLDVRPWAGDAFAMSPDFDAPLDDFKDYHCVPIGWQAIGTVRVAHTPSMECPRWPDCTRRCLDESLRAGPRRWPSAFSERQGRRGKGGCGGLAEASRRAGISLLTRVRVPPSFAA